MSRKALFEEQLAQTEQVSLDELDKRLAEYCNKFHDVTVSSILHATGPALRRVVRVPTC